MRQPSKITPFILGSTLLLSPWVHAQPEDLPTGKAYTCAKAHGKNLETVGIAINDGSTLMRGFANAEKGQIKEIGGVITGVHAPVRTEKSARNEAILNQVASALAVENEKHLETLQGLATGSFGGYFSPLQGLGFGVSPMDVAGYGSSNGYTTHGSAHSPPSNPQETEPEITKRAGDLASEQHRPGDKVPPAVGSSIGQTGNLSFGAQLDTSGNIRYLRYQLGQDQAVVLDNNGKNDVESDANFRRVQKYLEHFKTFAECCKQDAKSKCSIADKPELQALLKPPSEKTPSSATKTSGANNSPPAASFIQQSPFGSVPNGAAK